MTAAPDPRTLSDADLLAEYVGWMRLGDAPHLHAELLRRLADRDRLRDALRTVWETADDELRRLGAVPGSSVSQIEADAREALAAAGITVGE